MSMMNCSQGNAEKTLQLTNNVQSALAQSLTNRIKEAEYEVTQTTCDKKKINA